MVFTNNLKKIILCGHSYGAMVITGILQRHSARVQHMMFLDSAIPESGYSLYGLFAKYGVDFKDFGLTEDPACT